MIKKFEVGKWYKYVWDRPVSWNKSDPGKKLWEDGKARKCIAAKHLKDNVSENHMAEFEGIPGGMMIYAAINLTRFCIVSDMGDETENAPDILAELKFPRRWQSKIAEKAWEHIKGGKEILRFDRIAGDKETVRIYGQSGDPEVVKITMLLDASYYAEDQHPAIDPELLRVPRRWYNNCTKQEWLAKTGGEDIVQVRHIIDPKWVLVYGTNGFPVKITVQALRTTTYFSGTEDSDSYKCPRIWTDKNRLEAWRRQTGSSMIVSVAPTGNGRYSIRGREGEPVSVTANTLLSSTRYIGAEQEVFTETDTPIPNEFTSGGYKMQVCMTPPEGPQMFHIGDSTESYEETLMLDASGVERLVRHMHTETGSNRSEADELCGYIKSKKLGRESILARITLL